MEITLLLVLKYLGLLLTMGTAFVGSWFLEFTTTDKDTHRKRFTKWGRRGLLFAAIALVATLTASIWADHDAVLNQQRATELQKDATTQAEVERAAAAKFQKKSEVAMKDIKKLLTALSSTNLSNDDKKTVKQVVASLSGIDDYKKYFPDFYNRILSATTYTQVQDAILEGLIQAVNSRISDEPRCAQVPRAKPQMTGGNPSGLFMISNTVAFGYQIQPDGVQLNLSDGADSNSLGESGYSFVYIDGTNSDELRCTHRKTGMSCYDATTQPQVRAIYLELGVKPVARMRTAKKSYDVSDKVAKDMRDALSCVSP